MKKLFLTISIAAISAAASASGKINFNPGPYTVKFTSNKDLLFDGDVALAGLPIPNNPANLPSGLNIWLGLYGGTGPGSIWFGTMTYLTSVQINTGNGMSDGRILAQNINYTGSAIVGGQVAYLQLAAWSGADSNSRYGWMNMYNGVGNIFTMTPGSGVTYVSSLSGGGSTYQTEGILDSSTSVYISTIPEPSIFALVRLAAAAMLIFHRWRLATPNTQVAARRSDSGLFHRISQP